MQVIPLVDLFSGMLAFGLISNLMENVKFVSAFLITITTGLCLSALVTIFSLSKHL